MKPTRDDAQVASQTWLRAGPDGTERRVTPPFLSVRPAVDSSGVRGLHPSGTPPWISIWSLPRAAEASCPARVSGAKEDTRIHDQLLLAGGGSRLRPHGDRERVSLVQLPTGIARVIGIEDLAIDRLRRVCQLALRRRLRVGPHSRHARTPADWTAPTCARPPTRSSFGNMWSSSCRKSAHEPRGIHGLGGAAKGGVQRAGGGAIGAPRAAHLRGPEIPTHWLLLEAAVRALLHARESSGEWTWVTPRHAVQSGHADEAS